MTPDERQLFDDTLAELKNANSVSFLLDPGTAFALIGALQLACRHPAFLTTKTGAMMHVFTLKLQDSLAPDRQSAIWRSCERGWHKAFDMPVSREGN